MEQGNKFVISSSKSFLNFWVNELKFIDNCNVICNYTSNKQGEKHNEEC